MNSTISFKLSIMRSLETRKQSFIDNDLNRNSVDELSEVGFYYTGESGLVKCFNCSLQLDAKNNITNPWIAHLMFSPNCFFIKILTTHAIFSRNKNKFQTKNDRRWFHNIVHYRDYENNFEELEKIGEGLYGEVFKVRSKEETSKVADTNHQAIKKSSIINSNQFQVYNYVENILTLKYIDNKRIVKFFDVGIVIDSPLNQDFLFIQMELCDGNLRELLKDIQNDRSMTGNLNSNVFGYYLISNIFLEILEAVNYLHKQNPIIIHGNLKPENILFKKVNDSILIKIADTGLKALDEFSSRKQKNMNEKKYSEPNVLTEKNFNTKSDIFSLGTIVNELFEIDLRK
jgi:hypothetical protein